MKFAIVTATKKIAALKNKIRIIQGGTSASKTISILAYLISLAQSDKVPTLTSVISESFPHLKRGAIRDFKNIMIAQRYWVDGNWNASDNVYKFETGSQIEFFSADQPDKLRGGRRDRAFINECNNVDFDAFEQIEVRTKEFIFLDFNPTNEFWAFTEIMPYREDYDHIILTYKDNEACPDEIVKSIEARKNRKNWYAVYGLGQLGELEELVYKGWQTIDEIPHEARLERRYIDFGYTNDPTAIGEIYYYNGGWIINELVYRKGMGNKQIADYFNALDKAETTIVADSAEPKSIDEIRAYGLNVVASKKGADSKKFGIQLVQDQPISITRRSFNILKEVRNYMFFVDKDGKVHNDKTDPGCADHHMDGIRYGLETLGRLKQEMGYWDRVFEDQLNPKAQNLVYNKGR